MAQSASADNDFSYGLTDDEIINISILSEAILISAIFFTISIFYYSKRFQHNTLHFNCFYKLLSIIIVLMLFFLIVSTVSYNNTINNIHIEMIFVFICLMTVIVIANVIGMSSYPSIHQLIICCISYLISHTKTNQLRNHGLSLSMFRSINTKIGRVST